MTNFDCQPLGDQAVLLTFGESTSETIYTNIQHFLEVIRAMNFPWVIDIVPSYTTVCVYYDVMQIVQITRHLPYQFVIEALQNMTVTEYLQHQARTLEIPVVYGGKYGPDLSFVASYSGLTEEQVIARHTSGEYKVHMIGFLPGFPYLSGLDTTIAVPRKEVPSTCVAAGSVGIAGTQTGIYPVDSPGGWQIIGRTMVSLFDVMQTPPTYIQPGDTIKFKAIGGESDD